MGTVPIAPTDTICLTEKIENIIVPKPQGNGRGMTSDKPMALIACILPGQNHLDDKNQQTGNHLAQ